MPATVPLGRVIDETAISASHLMASTSGSYGGSGNAGFCSKAVVKEGDKACAARVTDGNPLHVRHVFEHLPHTLPVASLVVLREVAPDVSAEPIA
jgi:hypothetical protein